VRERCIVGPEFVAPVSDLFDEWKSWCVEHGRQRHGTRETFAKDLRAKLSGITRTQPRTAKGRIRAYKGIGLRSGTGWHAFSPIVRERQIVNEEDE
jgi:putative DNA primase/helicase